MTHHIAGAKHLAHGRAVVGRQDIEHTGRNAGAHAQLGCGQRRQRREFRRLDDDGAACGQRGRDFAGDHGQREVPGRDGDAHANGLLEHHQAAVVVKLRQRFAIDALGFLGKPLDKAGTVGDFALGLGKRLALLGGHDGPQVFLVGHQELIPLHQNGVALLAGLAAPGGPGGVGGGNGGFGILGAEVGDIGQFVAGSRVCHIKPAGAGQPLPIDQRIGLEQARVVES